MDVKDVLLDGRWEKAKDAFDPASRAWKYAFRGTIDDGRDIRVVIAERAPGIIVITAIDLSRKS
jgi:hypothetical protein